MPHIAELRRHPLKSGRIEHLTSAALVATGIEYDRSWMVVKPDGTFMNQKSNRRLAAIRPELDSKMIVFHGQKNDRPLPHEMADTVNRRRVNVTIYDAACLGYDLGDFAAEWMARELGEYVRLVQIIHDVSRTAKYDPEGTATLIGFQDAGTLLMTSEASLADLNQRLINRGEEPVPMDRFRPNIVVGGCDPYEEDTWRVIEVGGVHLHLTIPSRRCAITTYDQATGEKTGGEPFRMLSMYRKWERPGSTSGPKPIFGMNANHEGTGVLCVGQEITVLERGEPFVHHELAI